MKDIVFAHLKSDVDYIIRKLAGNGIEAEFIEEWGIGALNSCYRVATKNPHKQVNQF